MLYVLYFLQLCLQSFLYTLVARYWSTFTYPWCGGVSGGKEAWKHIVVLTGSDGTHFIYEQKMLCCILCQVLHCLCLVVPKQT